MRGDSAGRSPQSRTLGTGRRSGRRAGKNPWGARTLEWMISSPPPYYNFKKVPAVLAAPYDFGNPLPYIGLDAEPGAVEATPQSTTGLVHAH